MQPANVTTLKLLASGLFLAGFLLIAYATLSLGLILAGIILACTTVVISEIRNAKKELMESLKH